MNNLDELLNKLTKTESPTDSEQVPELSIQSLTCGKAGHSVSFYLLPIAWNEKNGQRLVLHKSAFFLRPVGVSMSVHNSSCKFFDYDGQPKIRNVITKVGYDFYSGITKKGLSAKDDLMIQSKSMLQQDTTHAIVLVTDDNKNPENIGKIMSFKLRKIMLGAITSKANPTTAQQKTGILPANPFDHTAKGVEYCANVTNVDGHYSSVDFSASGFAPNSIPLEEHIKTLKKSDIKTIEDLKNKMPDISYMLPKNPTDDEVISAMADFEKENNSLNLFGSLIKETKEVEVTNKVEATKEESAKVKDIEDKDLDNLLNGV